MEVDDQRQVVAFALWLVDPHLHTFRLDLLVYGLKAFNGRPLGAKLYSHLVKSRNVNGLVTGQLWTLTKALF